MENSTNVIGITQEAREKVDLIIKDRFENTGVKMSKTQIVSEAVTALYRKETNG